MVARHRDGSYIRKTLTSCQRCLAWGIPYAQGVCLACYNFAGRAVSATIGCCTGCARSQPLRTGYCRSCWCQAGEDRLHGPGDIRSRQLTAMHLPDVRFHQLFFTLPARRTPRPAATPPRTGAKGRPPKPAPAVAGRPDTRCEQLTLFTDAGPRRYRYSHIDLRTAVMPDNPWLARALHIAHTHAETRGWRPGTRRGIQRALVMLLAGYQHPDRIRVSDYQHILVPHCVSAGLVAAILAEIGIGDDDRPRAFDLWLAAKAADLPPTVRADVVAWATELHDGGPRRRPRPKGAHAHVRAVLAPLHQWTGRHLREITTGDLVAYCADIATAPARQQTIGALRSLFGWAKRHQVIFRNPAARLRNPRAHDTIWQPLPPNDLARSAAAATTLQAKATVALAAIHAARPGQIRAMKLGDVDLANQRLTIGGISRPLDDLTRGLLDQWLRHRRRRWPHTANPHLFITRESAMRHGPASATWILNLRGLPGTLERLRIDRQLEEAITSGSDPLHLANLFGIADSTAVRYANNARKLGESAAEHQTAHRVSAASPPHTDVDPPLSSS